MLVFLLNPDNLHFLKNELRTCLPIVKSTHRLEAVAASMMYRTYASLLADINANASSGKPLAAIVEPERFRTRLEELGYLRIDNSILSQITTSINIPVPPWREHRSGDYSSNNRWFAECKRRNIPNVWIEMRTKYAKLNWDCISLDICRLDYLNNGRGENVVNDLFQTFQVLAHPNPGKAIFFGSAFAGSIDNLLPQIARGIANNIFVLLWRATKFELDMEEDAQKLTYYQRFHRSGRATNYGNESPNNTDT